MSTYSDQFVAVILKYIKKKKAKNCVENIPPMLLERHTWKTSKEVLFVLKLK